MRPCLRRFSVRPRICRQIRSGPLGRWIDDFVDVLTTRGYATTVIRYYVRAAAVFSVWLEQQGMAATEVDGPLVARFDSRLPRWRARERRHGRVSAVAGGVGLLINDNFFAGRRDGDRRVAGAPAGRVTLPVFLVEDGLVTTVFTALCRWYPGRFQPGQLPTLQRPAREWRVQYGPDREVYFEPVAVPGREAAFDFTDASDLGVTLRGVGFPHLLFEWVLSYSRWTSVRLALSETCEALVGGVQGALWTLGAVPAVLRHDNLSAATHEPRRSGGRQLTVRFRQVVDHYGLRWSRIQPGKPHENGVAEQSHFRTMTAIEQALLLRGDRDFVDESAYLRFVRAVVDESRNTRAAARLAEERPYLRPLPSARVPEYTTFQCVVRKDDVAVVDPVFLVEHDPGRRPDLLANQLRHPVGDESHEVAHRAGGKPQGSFLAEQVG